MTSRRTSVMLFLAGVLACWSCVGETQGVGGQRFDVRGTVVDSGGRRVGDALVVLIDSGRDVTIDWDRAEYHAGAFVARTDVRGVFVMAEVPQSSYVLYARDEDGQAHVRRIGFHDDPPPPYDIRLSTTELEGTVFWPDDRTPVADAIVGLDYDFFMTRTDELGNFRFVGVEPKEYTVVTRARVPLTPRQAAAVEAHFKTTGHRSMSDLFARAFEEIVVEARVTVKPDEVTQLTMLLPGGIVQGVVMTDAGAPAVGARVSSGRRADITDDAGRFELTHVPIGRGVVVIRGRNREIGRNTVQVAPGGEPTQVEITLYPFRPQVTFRFTTPDGAVIANEGVTQVTRRYANGRVAMRGFGGLKTDDNGEWRDQWMYSGSCHYAFLSKTFGYAEQTVVIGDGVPEVHHEITLDPGGSICGIVRDQLTGAPLGGVVLGPTRVEVDGSYDQQSLWNGFSGFRRRSVTDPVSQISRDGDGTFCLRNLPPGTYRIYGRGVHAEEITLDAAEHVSGVEIMVETALAQRWIVGRVLGPDRTPVVTTEVTFVIYNGGPAGPFGRSGGVPRRALTDDLGFFRVGPLDARDYVLWARTPEHRGKSIPVDVTAESIDVGDVQLSANPSP